MFFANNSILGVWKTIDDAATWLFYQEADPAAGAIMNPATLIWGVIFGSIGFGFVVYGKKQGVFVPLVSGIGLILCPYVISGTLLLVSVCAVLVALPFFIKR